jgi:predicted ATPase
MQDDKTRQLTLALLAAPLHDGSKRFVKQLRRLSQQELRQYLAFREPDTQLTPLMMATITGQTAAGVLPPGRSAGHLSLWLDAIIA